MSNPYLDAAKDLERVSKMFAGLVSLGDTLTRIGSLEQAAQEAEARVKAAEDRVTEASARAAEAGGLADAAATRLEELHRKQDAIAADLDAARAKAKTIEQAGQAEADKVRKAAETELANARREALSIVLAGEADAEAVRKDAEIAANGIDGVIAQRRAALADIEANCEAAQKRLDGINAEIEAVRRRFGA
jgi:chromosome segregation ATPase